MRRIAPLLLVSALVLCAPLAVSAAAPTFELPVRALQHRRATTSTRGDFSPVAATNGSGAWVVAWSSSDTLLGTVDGGNNILFMRSTDGGLTFMDPALRSTNATGKAPALAAHGEPVHRSLGPRVHDRARALRRRRGDLERTCDVLRPRRFALDRD